jgi:hypothetical protein
MSEDFKCQADDTAKGEAVSPPALQAGDSGEARRPLPVSHILGFHPGEFMVRSDGSGSIAFDEDDVDFEPCDDRVGNIIKVELEASELIAIRDWLNERFPQSSALKRQTEEPAQAGDERPAPGADDRLTQKANDIMDEACLGEPWVKNGVDAALRVAIAAALRAEREACARFVENWPHVHPNVSSSIAKAIRIGDTHD